MDGELTLWIAGIVAAIFVFLVIYDSVKRSRKRKRHERRLRAFNPQPSRFARVRDGYRSLKNEAERRQRHSARMRRLNKSRK